MSSPIKKALSSKCIWNQNFGQAYKIKASGGLAENNVLHVFGSALSKNFC